MYFHAYMEIKNHDKSIKFNFIYQYLKKQNNNFMNMFIT